MYPMEAKIVLATPMQKFFLALTFTIGLGVCGMAAWQKLQARTFRVTGYIVAKEWRKAHMSDVEPARVQQTALGVVYLAPTSFHPSIPRPVPSSFRVWVANRNALREVQVDSASWDRLRCGQRCSYLLTE